MKLVPESLNELQNFDRNQDPKKSLQIGVNQIIPTITSDDLEMFSDYSDGEEEWEEEFEANRMGEVENYEEELQRVKMMYLALKDKIRYGEFFDYKQEEEMDEYLEKEATDEEYIYNAYPASDGYLPVFSKIELPQAENI